MAKTYKTHKKSKKYGFQRNKKNTLAWLIAIAAVIAAVVIGVFAYNNSLTGEFDVTVPADAALNNIAENWKVLESNTDKFLNYYASNEGGVDENGATMLAYTGSEHADLVYIYIKPTQFFEDITPVGMYARPSIFTVDLGQLLSGEISLKNTSVAIQAGNENCMLYLQDYNTEKVDDSAVHAIVAELEALIAAGPVVTEEAAETAE